jgi:hypothetical protein
MVKSNIIFVLHLNEHKALLHLLAIDLGESQLIFIYKMDSLPLDCDASKPK